MGKPFKNEIDFLPKTFEWASKVDLGELGNILQDFSRPVVLVGSGGSYGACFYAYQHILQKGAVGFCFTPMQVFENAALIKNCHVIVLSASGNNIDVLNVIRFCFRHEVKKVSAFVLSDRSKIKKLFGNDNRLNSIEFKTPGGKDGFLATNSLLAFSTLIFRAYNDQELGYEHIAFDQKSFKDEVSSFFEANSQLETLVVIYSGWSTPIALDIESKFSEAALGNILLCDWRNFAHGRHHWFDKRNADSAILALTDPTTMPVADKTLAHLPASAKILKVNLPDTTSISTLEGLLKAFLLVQIRGEQLSIDPGRPGVPEYGSEIYNLNYQKLLFGEKPSKDEFFVARKLPVDQQADLKLRDIWTKYLKAFCRMMKTTQFHSIVFDYDDTLCGSKREDRYRDGLDKRVAESLNTLLGEGITIAIATGRGKSAGSSLRASIRKEHWDQVVMGYYNGSQIGLLSDLKTPAKKGRVHQQLSDAATHLSAVIGQDLTEFLRPNQITLRMDLVENWSINREILREEIALKFDSLRVLESSHSIDIIPNMVTKLDVVRWCESKNINKVGEVLCIGDKGKWPGNDFELLSHRYSLSVDDVSSSGTSCWNLAPLGVRKLDATIYYLNRFYFKNGGLHFKV